MESPIPAKITRPRSSDAYPRTRLFKSLDHACRRPLVWVMGPPGAGKTLLVADYLARRRYTTLWYQADASDGDSATLFHYLGLAARKTAPRIRRPLPVPQPDPGQAGGLDHFARRYFDALYARLAPPFALVLDNYQDIPTGAGVHDILPVMVETLPAGGHIVVMSRNEPPPSLARLRLHDGVAMIEDSELRLTLPEAQGLARRRGGAARRHVTEQHALTQGWAAGLVLLLEQAGDKTPDAPAKTRTPGVLFEYFANEVFGKTDPETQAVLLKSVFLPSMSVPMVAALTGERRAGRILNHLSRNNFFTSCHSLPEPVYQYHPLFREFLLSRATRRFPPEELRALRRRAAVLLEQAGANEAALSLYEQTQDWPDFERCLTCLAPVLLAEGRNRAVEQWLDRLPAGHLVASPWLLYWRANAQLSYDPGKGRRGFEQALSRFREVPDARGAQLAWCGVVNAILHEGHDYAALHDWIGAYGSLPGGGTMQPDTEARVTASMLHALVRVQPQHPDVDNWSARAVALLQSRGSANDRVDAGTHVVVHALYRGEPARAAQISQQLEAAAATSGVEPLTRIMVLNATAFAHWMSAAPAAALANVHEALALADQSGVQLWNPHLLAHATAAALTAGDLDDASRWLDRLAGALDGARPLDIGFYHYLANWHALLRGDTQTANEQLRLSERLPTGLGAWFAKALFRHAETQTLLATGHCAEAAMAIASLEELARDNRSLLYEFIAGLLAAQLALQEQREPEALDLLAQALALGRRQGLMNFHGWLPRSMARLCAAALEAGIETEYVRELVQKRSLPPVDEAHDLAAWPWPLRIHALGRLSIVRDEQPLAFPGKAQRRPLELLQALIAFGGRAVPETALAQILWPDADGDAAHRAFDTTLHRLRRLLGSDRALLLSDGRLSLNPAVCWLDVWAFERVLARLDARLKQASAGDGTDATGLARLAEHLSTLYRGPLLDGEYTAAWTIAPRERLHSRFVCQLGALGLCWEERGDWQRAAETYHRAIDVDELVEEYYQRLMRAYHRLGRPSEVLAVYRRCRETLQAGLGRPPSAVTESLRHSRALIP